MTDRQKWQYCQLEVDPSGNTGDLKTFIPDGQPTVIALKTAWPGMIGKLGDQGWELVSAMPPTEMARSVHGPMIYVFKRPI